MKCPKCGNEMEHGYLNTTGYPIATIFSTYSANWSKSPNASVTASGETLASPPGGLGSFILEGFRCKKDRILILSY